MGGQYLSIASGNFDPITLAILSGAIASGQLGLRHFASGLSPVTSGSIFSNQIASGQIGQFSLASGLINSGHIGNNAVVSGSIGSGQIGANHLASGVVSAASASTIVRRKDADQSIGGASGWVDDDTLSFNIGANEVWVGHIVTFGVSRNGDQNNPAVRISTGVSSTEFNLGSMSVDADAIGQCIGSTGNTTTGTESSSFNAYGNSTGNNGLIYIPFSVKNGGSPGTFKVQWNAATGGSTIREGAFLFAAKQ